MENLLPQMYSTTKYYHNSHSVPTMVFKMITVDRMFRVPTAVTIQKKYMFNRMGYMVIFSHLEGISNAAQLLEPIVNFKS